MKQFVKSLMGLIVFIIKLLVTGQFRGRHYYKKRYSGKMIILANGPSLKNILPEIGVKAEFSNSEFTVMNYFALDPAFQTIQPRFYCLADPMFIRKDHRYEQVKKLFCHLQETVDWDMNLYIPRWFGQKDFYRYSSLTNPHIHIISVNDILYEGFGCFKHWLLRENVTIPFIGTVAQLGIYAALNNGFDEIYLYGVDHNMTSSLFVDDKNQLCKKEEHFYDHSTVLKPIVRANSNEKFKISEYYTEMGMLFRSHDQLANYAKSLGVRVVNCTRNSMIDSYERKKC